MPPKDPDFGANLNLPEGGVPVDSLTHAGPVLRNLGITGAITPEVISEHSADIGKALREGRSRLSDIRGAGLENELKDTTTQLSGFISELKTLLSGAAFKEHFLPGGQMPAGAAGDKSANFIHLLAAASQRLPGDTIDKQKNVVSQESLTRAEARIARSILREGGSLPTDMRNRLQSSRGDLDVEVRALRQEFEKQYKVNPEEARRISTQVASKSALSQEITNVIKADSKETKHGIDKAMSFMTQIASTMAVGSIVTSRMLTDPYKYQFQPAMSALSKQGALGQTLSSAYGAEKGYDVQNNTQAAYAGMGLLGMGTNIALSGKGAAGVIGGGLLAAGGLAVGGLGLTGHFNDILQSLNLKLPKDTIVGTQIAQQIADPNALLNPFNQSRAGLFAMGGGNQSNFGYYLNGQINENTRGGTGNAILDRIAGQGTMLNSLGYSGAQAGQLLSSVSQNVVGSRSQLADYTTYAGKVAKGFGMDESQVIGLLATATRAGSTNAQQSTNMAMGAVSNNGELTNYQANVLVPALMKVTESMSIRNVARTSQDLQQEIYGLRSSMQNSNTPLGNLVRTNPQAFGKIYGDMNTAVKSALNNPALMAQDIMMGSSIGDIVQGKASVFTNRLDRLMVNNPVFRNINSTKDMMNNQMALHSLLALGGNVGISDPQELTQLFLMRKNGNLSTKDFNTAAQKVMDQGSQSEIDKRAMAIVDSKFGTLIKSMADQANAMQTATQSVTKDILKIQGEITAFAASTKLTDLAAKGIQTIVDQITSLVGDKKASSDKGLTGTAQKYRDSVAAGGAGNTSGGGLSATIQKYRNEPTTGTPANRWAMPHPAANENYSVTSMTPPYNSTHQPQKSVDVAGVQGDSKNGYTVVMNVTGLGKEEFTKAVKKEINTFMHNYN